MMTFFTRLLLLFMIGLYLPCSFSAEAEGKIRQPAPEWQIQGALAAWRDKIPEVKVLGLKKLIEIGAVERIPKEEIMEVGRLLEAVCGFANGLDYSFFEKDIVMCALTINFSLKEKIIQNNNIITNAFIRIFPILKVDTVLLNNL